MRSVLNRLEDAEKVGEIEDDENLQYLAAKLPLLKLSNLQRKVVCEGVGAFIFLLTISLAEQNCGLSAIDGKSHTRNLAPIAEGFILCVLIFTFGYISGGHFNPAVTFAVVMVHGMRIEEAIGYWIAQVVGAFLGSGLGILVNGTTRHLPAPQVYRNSTEYVFIAFMGETIFTGLLVLVVLH
ncbi:aquaporin-like protein, partial [Angomonas deanei]